jgi:hypothetical protein
MKIIENPDNILRTAAKTRIGKNETIGGKKSLISLSKVINYYLK